MLINRVPEEESGRVGDADMHLEDNSAEFQTAEEIYQIMAKDNTFEGDGDKALTTRDLVILYKNIDIDTKLVSSTNKQTSKRPNQYVENVVYNDDRGSEGSDFSEDISNGDFKNVFAINEERIDLLNNFGDTLCHKFGDMQIRTSDLNIEYDKHFLFNDPIIKGQLKSFHKISKPKQSDSTVLPASLLDYICCKRIEDNYDFYIDNIIKYVQNTIEQLKRISNGEYLTEKVKEKWREVYEDKITTPEDKSQLRKIVLANSVSIPLRVKEKRTDQRLTWDDIVHSEMDVRSLSKILEKKVIVEVPKIICGTYSLFSKRCKDNLIITCKKDREEESRVDVVLKLQRSNSGHVISNIDSIMILKSLPAIASESETHSNNLLALEFEKFNALDKKVEQETEMKSDENTEKILPNDTTDQKLKQEIKIESNENIKDVPPNKTAYCNLAADKETEAEKFSENDYDSLPQSDCQEDNECDSSGAEADFSTIATDDLHSIIHRLSKQTPVIEESEDNIKRKSPMRVRIKSPYENKSYAIEEKKRKKLLEIREKRELKKNAMSENCRIKKHRNGRGSIMVQSSDSVTKLSITNKYFYNSIYGHPVKINTRNSQRYHKDQTRVAIPKIQLKDDDETQYDADTEVMYLQRKENESQNLTNDASTPPAANDIGVNLNFLRRLISPSTTDFSLTNTSSSLQQNVLRDDSFVNTEKEITQKNALMSTRSTQVSVPANLPKLEVNYTQVENCKTTSSVECRRSIDKIYDLIKQIGKTDSLEVMPTSSKAATNIDKLNITCGKGNSKDQATDSGTSIKHQLTSSNPSSCCFEKPKTVVKTSKDSKKKYENPTSIIPKITIGSKPAINKINNKANNKEFKKLSCSKIQENPLKAISQLIHEFDNVQKTTVKNEKEPKKNKKTESLTTQDKSSFRQNFLKRMSKRDQYLKESEAISSKKSVLIERKRQGTGYGPPKITQQQLQHEEDSLDTNRKKIADIIDEVKELRGEAVRGPSRNLARLNSLAQPKKSNLQSQQEEPLNRFGKRVMDRLSKPTPPTPNPEKSIGLTRTKQRKIYDELPSSTKQPHSAGLPTERLSRAKPHNTNNNSPNRDGFGKRSLGPVGKPTCIHGNVNKLPEELKGKMVAVETYVKSHYGRDSRSLETGNSYSAHKSRVPLIPNDLDVVSLTSSPSTKEESSTLGKKLHSMVDSMISSTMPVLGAVAECNESVSKASDGFDDTSIEKRSNSDEIILSSSDYPVDIFEDKNIVTAVSVISLEQKDDEIANCNINMCETNQPCPPNELHNPESETCHQIQNGTFQKLMRGKNLILNVTPKQSMENLLTLRSEDKSSLVLKSKLSQDIINEKTETITELKILPVLSNTCFTNFNFTNFPMQIATIGYALPQYLVKHDSKTKIRLLENEDSRSKNLKAVLSSENVVNAKLSKSIRCFKDVVKKTSQKTTERESIICLLRDENKNEVSLDNHEEFVIKIQNNERQTQDNSVKTKTSNEDIVVADIEKSNISNSTSLDILVGLLNEIKKITSYQAHISKQEDTFHTDLEKKELEVILNNVSIKESSVDQSVDNAISLHSLDKLQKLEVRDSNFLYLFPNIEDHNRGKKTSDKNITTNDTLLCGPLDMDKEINTKFRQTECINRFTEAPSRPFPVSVSTNITDSLIKLINKPSCLSIYSVTDCESFTLLANEIKEVPSKPLKKSTDSVSPLTTLKIQYINEKEKYKDIKEQNSHSLIEFDPLMKMKRDILVTVYSILVLTVFAALSFPEIMYRV
ncbi:uncharacterized protein LOC123874500 isoform X2 [Maniola jurtina]|uniref:uncharacterized protein LOC123874500 isoform X2 n=1 Tax=Maniola jurtina TaxID=191418 RepID=UPI001E6875AE|nr:uncharacterized protein LOC123874500 isoform X2 [Maniola jurtina]